MSVYTVTYRIASGSLLVGRGGRALLPPSGHQLCTEKVSKIKTVICSPVISEEKRCYWAWG